jgi:hypothetical protein
LQEDKRSLNGNQFKSEEEEMDPTRLLEQQQRQYGRSNKGKPPTRFADEDFGKMKTTAVAKMARSSGSVEDPPKSIEEACDFEGSQLERCGQPPA